MRCYSLGRRGRETGRAAAARVRGSTHVLTWHAQPRAPPKPAHSGPVGCQLVCRARLGSLASRPGAEQYYVSAAKHEPAGRCAVPRAWRDSHDTLPDHAGWCNAPGRRMPPCASCRLHGARRGGCSGCAPAARAVAVRTCVCATRLWCCASEPRERAPRKVQASNCRRPGDERSHAGGGR